MGLIEQADELFARQAFHEAVSLYEKASLELPFEPDPLLRFHAVIQAIKCYSYLQNEEKESRLAVRATAEIQLVSNFEMRAKIAHVLGNVTFETNLISTAVEFFQTAISLYGKLENFVGQAEVLLDYKSVHEHIGDWQGAYNTLQIVAENLHNISKFSAIWEKYLLNKGRMEAFILGNLDKGENIFEDLYRLLDRADPSGYMGWCLGNIALLKLQTGQFFDALRLSGRVSWIARINQNILLFLLAQEIFIFALKAEGRFQESKYAAEWALAAYNGPNRIRMLTAKMRGLCGETEDGVDLFYEAIAVAEKHKALWEELIAKIWLTDLYVSSGNLDKGKEIGEGAVKILEIIMKRFELPLREEFLERNADVKTFIKLAKKLNIKNSVIKEPKGIFFYE